MSKDTANYHKRESEFTGVHPVVNPGSWKYGTSSRGATHIGR